MSSRPTPTTFPLDDKRERIAGNVLPATLRLIPMQVHDAVFIEHDGVTITVDIKALGQGYEGEGETPTFDAEQAVNEVAACVEALDDESADYRAEEGGGDDSGGDDSGDIAIRRHVTDFPD